MSNKENPEGLEHGTPIADFFLFLHHLNSESERGQVLICASVLDEQLLRILRAFLIKGASADKLLTGFNAPLSTLSARTEAAHAMGLISDDERHDAVIIRKIRNEFAHTLIASFSDDNIKGWSASLRLRAKDYEEVTVSSRGQFSTAATALIINLSNRAHYVGAKRLAWVPWQD